MEKNIYSRAKVSVKLLDAVIILGLVALVAVTVCLSVTGGFDISFDTRGGSEVESQRLRYGERVSEPEVPSREGYVFLGWYADEELTRRVDVSKMTATESTTLYASWGSFEK